MRHHSVIAWEARLDAVMRKIDLFLEEKYHGEYALHQPQSL